MTTVITGLFRDAAAADEALAQLVANGVGQHEISVILKSTPHHEQLVLEETNDTPRGVLTGAVGGGVLASLAFAALALPGIGILASGPVIAGLAAGTTGAVAGGIIGAMTGHGVSSMTAQEYETAIRQGRALVAVHTVHAQAKRVKKILASTGATSVYDAVHFSHDVGDSGAG